MKIALVSPYDFTHPGGVVNHICALANEFIKQGHDVRIIAPAAHPPKDMQDKLVVIGRPYAVLVPGTVLRISLSLHLAPKIKAVLAQERFDIIHLHEPFMPMLCSAMLRFSDSVNIGTFHACGGKPGYSFGKPVTSILLRRRNRKLHGRIAVSEAAMKYAAKSVQGDFSIIPNGVDLKRFNPEVQPFPQYKDGKLNIVFVGRLESRKGVKYLLEAYKLLKKDFPDIRLLIVGPGVRLRRQYEVMVKSNNLQDVVFTGAVAYDELPRYYQTADIFCSPATGRESFGMVLLEAMALGKPVVASNIEGYTSVVTHEYDGLLVPPRNARALAEVIRKLLQDESLRLRIGANGLATVQKYDWPLVASQVMDYYKEILSKTGQKQSEMISEAVATGSERV
jgi:phosphatidylinositol alpha-mannosyltransferase